MSKDTNIEWCDSTINGTSGCDGCELWNANRRVCYAGNLHENRWSKSFALTHPDWYAASFDVVKMIPGRFAQAARWSDLRGTDRPEKPWLNGLPRCIFVGDMGDFLSRNVTDEFLEREMMGAIRSPEGQRHFWMLLTKRPDRLAKLSKAWGGLPVNVIAMTTVTDQATANLRVPQLLGVDCHWRGISAEPLLGPAALNSTWLPAHTSPPLFSKRNSGFHDSPRGGIHLVIVGGESGSNARPMNPGWARSLRDQCSAAGVAFHFKQWGEFLPDTQNPSMTHAVPLPADYSGAIRVGKRAAGRCLDGIEHNGFPSIRQS